MRFIVGYIITNETMEEIQQMIADIEKNINSMNKEIDSLAEEKVSVTSDYEEKKKQYESAKEEYIEKSSSGKYFLIVNVVAFVLMAFMTATNSLVDFLMIPATVLLAIAIILRLIGLNKFKSLKASMIEKDAAYVASKEKYESFMALYRDKELELEKLQYKWELVENDRLAARAEAWEAAHRTAAN